MPKKWLQIKGDPSVRAFLFHWCQLIAQDSRNRGPYIVSGAALKSFQRRQLS
jgi:hypothetical protein